MLAVDIESKVFKCSVWNLSKAPHKVLVVVCGLNRCAGKRVYNDEGETEHDV